MQLESERLLLREWKRTDWKDVHEYAKDPDVVRFMEWGPNTTDETLHFVDTALDSQRIKPRKAFEFAVVLKETGKVIGACGLRVLPFDGEQADVGYVFNKSYWGQGYGSEACSRIIKFGFEELSLHRIFATCDADNSGSSGVLRKSGMRQEGHFVQDKKIKGTWRDTLLLAVLRDEWCR